MYENMLEKCPSCGSIDIEQDRLAGEGVCWDCSEVWYFYRDEALRAAGVE